MARLGAAMPSGRQRVRGLIALTILVAGVGGWLVISRVTAAGGKLSVQSYAAAAFVPVEESTHNNNGDSVCAAGFQASQPGSENKGDLNAKKGSFLRPVELPQGASVRQLRLWANDFDGDDGAHVFLVRKKLKAGLSPQFKGYAVMAKTQSTGAVLNTMRKFTDTSVNHPTVDNKHFYYYLELVNCAPVEPFAVQVGLKR